MTLRPFAVGVAVALAAGAAARADTLFTLGGPTAQMPTPGFLDVTFDAGSGAGDVAFRIDGFRTLDGVNDCCADTFSLLLNGSLIFQGSWDMGGGGVNTIFLAPPGATADPQANPGFGHGGHTDIFVPLTLAAGQNTLRFQYSGRDQGLDDESWALEGVTVQGAGSATPEPTAWALMILGFTAVGAAVRRRALVEA